MADPDGQELVALAGLQEHDRLLADHVEAHAVDDHLLHSRQSSLATWPTTPPCRCAATPRCCRRRMAMNSAMLQLQAAVASLTLVGVLGVEGLLGLGPAIVLACGALTALPAGRAMDRVGRVPVLAAGFVAGAIGCGLAALGSSEDLAPVVLAGLVVRRRGRRRRAADAHRGGRHVPAGAAGARHRAGALRVGVRRAAGTLGVQPAALRPGARRGRARAALARGQRLHARWTRAGAERAAGPAQHRPRARLARRRGGARRAPLP